MLTGRRAEAAVAVAEMIMADGAQVETMLGDIGDADFADALVAATVERFGRLDMVANVAGVITRGEVAATTDED